MMLFFLCHVMALYGQQFIIRYDVPLDIGSDIRAYEVQGGTELTRQMTLPKKNDLDMILRVDTARRTRRCG